MIELGNQPRVPPMTKNPIIKKNYVTEANAYNALFFKFFFIANYCFFLFAFFLGPYSERNFIYLFVNSFGLRV